MNTKERKIDVVSVGELLTDLISTDFVENMDEAENFRRIQGGSAANLAMNAARLGNRVKLIATVGNDDMGHFLYHTVQKSGADCHDVRRVDLPTTLILVTRSKTVADFTPYRGADKEISADQFPPHIFEQAKLFHTTCFALSAEPAQSHILSAAEKAAHHGCRLSIDLNYAEKIWPARDQAQHLVELFCEMGALIKVSEVDWERLYESPLEDFAAAAQHFLKLGATQVCITMGSEGCYVADKKEEHFLPAREVDVKDTTGAGDAFWSGYLTAFAAGKSLLECGKAGRRMAEIKLETFGNLPTRIDREQLFVD